jgi:hypothetical protein
MEMYADRTKAMPKLRQLFPVQIMIHQKYLKDFKYLGSIVTNDARCNLKLNPGLPWQKAAFNRRKILFTSNLYVKLKITLLHLEHSLLW